VDADAFERPNLGRRDDFRPFFGDKEGIAAEGGAGAGVPGDGPTRLEQLLRLRRERHFDGGSAGEMALRRKLPFVLESADEINASPGQQDLAA